VRLRVLDSMLRFRDGPHYLSMMVLRAVRTDRLLLSWFCPLNPIDLHISSGLFSSLPFAGETLANLIIAMLTSLA